MAAGRGPDRTTFPFGVERGRSLGLFCTASALFLIASTPADAQRCGPPTVTLSVAGQSRSEPSDPHPVYNRDMTAWVAPEAGRKTA